MSANLNTASSLRWRARVAKEAMLNDDDDSNYYSSPGNRPQNHHNSPVAAAGDRWEVVEASASKDQPSSESNSCSYQSLSKILLNCISVTAVACSVYAQSQILPVMATNTTLQIMLWYVIFLSCLLSASFAMLAVWQHTKLRKMGSIRRVHNHMRHTVRSLKQQNERVRRNLTLLDGSIDRLRQVEHELQTYANNSAEDTHRLVRVVNEHKRMQRELQGVLRRQVQEQILQAVLQTDRDRDCSLSPQELERLIVRLKSVPGVQVREAQLRSMLVRQTTSGADLPLASVLQLIRQVGDDATKPAVAAGAKERKLSRQVNLQDQEDDDVTVFRFCPQQLVSNGEEEQLIRL